MNFFTSLWKSPAVAEFQHTPSKLVPGGLLIAFEGIDGSGKTTTAQRIVSRLQSEGYNSKYLREPTDGEFGRQLRQIMVSEQERNAQKEFELFIQDRRQDVTLNICPLMKAGGIVCIDRYYISSMAYQGALGLDPDMIRKANETFAPIPDLILRFCVPVDVALQRIKLYRSEGANQFEQREYLEKVEWQFRQMTFTQLTEIDATQTPDEVFYQAWNVICKEPRLASLG